MGTLKEDAAMNPTTSDEEEIFCQALEIQDASQREAFLRHACHPDARLRQIVDDMLADHDQATRLLQKVAADITVDEDAQRSENAPVDHHLGSTIGPYRLIQRLGEGGGGIVYEASQESPVHRRVALKILKPGLDHHRVVKRFQTERQALELMEHLGRALFHPLLKMLKAELTFLVTPILFASSPRTRERSFELGGHYFEIVRTHDISFETVEGGSKLRSLTRSEHI